MRKKIKAIHVLLLCLTGLLGVLLGIGVALLALNLTTQEKWLTFAGLLCLIVLAALCLALPLLVHALQTNHQPFQIQPLVFQPGAEVISEHP